jgi:hypothetical protein
MTSIGGITEIAGLSAYSERGGGGGFADRRSKAGACDGDNERGEGGGFADRRSKAGACDGDNERGGGA